MINCLLDSDPRGSKTLENLALNCCKELKVQIIIGPRGKKSPLCSCVVSSLDKGVKLALEGIKRPITSINYPSHTNLNSYIKTWNLIHQNRRGIL